MPSNRERSWGSYQHSYGSAGGAEVGIDLGSDLMRLAAGGAPPAPEPPKAAIEDPRNGP